MISEERNSIDKKEVIETKIKFLNDPEFEKPTSYDKLIKEHRKTRAAVRELVKNKRSYNTAAQQEREKAFIKAHEEVMNTKRARQIFQNKEEAIKPMKSLPKSGRKKKASGPLTSVLVPVPTETKELE